MLQATPPAFSLHVLDRTHHELLLQPEQRSNRPEAEQQLLVQALANEDAAAELIISEEVFCQGRLCAPLAFHYYTLVHEYGRPKLVQVRTTSPDSNGNLVHAAALTLMGASVLVLLMASFGWLLGW